MVKQLDALAPTSGDQARAIGDWIEANAAPDGAVAKMKSADRQAIAEAIGGVCRRLVEDGQSIGENYGVFDGLIPALADLGPDALPAISSVRKVDEQFRGGRTEALTTALDRLYALKGGAAGK